MTNFATYIDSANDRAPIAQRGHAKQKRRDLRLVGLGLVITRDGGIPLVSHAYAGNKPDVTQFSTVIDTLAARHAAVAQHAGEAGGRETRRWCSTLARTQPRQLRAPRPHPGWAFRGVAAPIGPARTCWRCRATDRRRRPRPVPRA